METITGPAALLAWRTGCSLSQREVGELVGVPQSTVSCWEALTRRPTIVQAMVLDSATKGAVRADTWGHPEGKLARVRNALASPGQQAPAGSSFTTSVFATEVGHEQSEVVDESAVAEDDDPSGPVVITEGYSQVAGG